MKNLLLSFLLAVVICFPVSFVGYAAEAPVTNTEQLMCAEKAAAIQSLAEINFHTVFIGQYNDIPVVGMIQPPTGDKEGLFIILSVKPHEGKILLCHALKVTVFQSKE